MACSTPQETDGSTEMTVVATMPVFFTIMICELLQEPEDQPENIKRFLRHLMEKHPFTIRKQDSQHNCYVAEIHFHDGSLTLEQMEEFFHQNAMSETWRVQPTILLGRMLVNLAA